MKSYSYKGGQDGPVIHLVSSSRVPSNKESEKNRGRRQERKNRKRDNDGRDFGFINVRELIVDLVRRQRPIRICHDED